MDSYVMVKPDDPKKMLLDPKPVSFRDCILLSPYTKFVVPTILIALIVPSTIYLVVFFGKNSEDLDGTFSRATCNILPSYYVNCLPGLNTSQAYCSEIGCCWDQSASLCYHAVPSRHGFTPSESTYTAGGSLHPRRPNSPLGSANVKQLYLDVTGIDSNHIQVTLHSSEAASRRKRRAYPRDTDMYRKKQLAEEIDDDTEEDAITRKLLHFLPSNRKRRAVELEINADSNLTAYAHYPEFSVTVARVDSATEKSTPVLTTARGPLIVTESYWEWTLFLTDSSVYGLNDLELNGTTSWVYNNENGTVTPAFLGITEDGKAVACYVDYEGPLEVQVLNGSNLIVLRGLALPESISLHVFAGPTPLEAIKQLTASINNQSYPLIESYGLHICPTGNLSSVENAIENLNKTIETLETLKAPWDSHCLHERLCPFLEHSLSADNLETVASANGILATESRNLIPHLSPMVLASNSILHESLGNKSLLLSNDSGVYIGMYQNEDVVFPDWMSTETSTITLNYFSKYLEDLGISKLLFLRDDWPKDENGMAFNAIAMGFDYMPKELQTLMSVSTIPFNLVSTSASSHHTSHNSYSKGFRNFIRSSVTTMEFLGPPGEAGNTSWSGLKRAVRAGVGAGLVGRMPSPMYVCGYGDYNASLHDELCIRWYQAAVAWPQILVLPERVPGGSLLSQSASLTASKALKLRGSLSTYQHAVLAEHCRGGNPVLAPTSVYFREDLNSRHTWDQFMWGDALLVGLVTMPRTSQVSMWIPGNLPWKHLKGGLEVGPSINTTISVTASVGQIITLVRPGYIVPVHEDVSMTTLETMQSNITLIGNLACDSECLAFGTMFYGSKEGGFLSILASNTTLVLDNILGVQEYACVETKQQSTVLQSLELLGVSTHEVGVDLCNFTEDSVELSLS